MSSSSHNKNEEARRILVISRTVWPIVAAAAGAGGRRGAKRGQCVWAMGVAEALFPLVALACSLVLRTPLRAQGPHGRRAPSGPGGPGRGYLALEWAAMVAGGQRMRCLGWILGRKATRNNERECLVVLWGLCAAGNLSLANDLVTSSSGGGSCGGMGASGSGWRGTGLVWGRYGGTSGEGTPGFLEDEVRSAQPKFLNEVEPCEFTRFTRETLAHCGEESLGHYEVTDFRDAEDRSLLSEVCARGHLDTAKWLVSTFHMREPWEFAIPFCCALAGGHLEVSKWLTTCFDVKMLTHNFLSTHLFPIDVYAGRSGSLPLVKWFLEEFEDLPTHKTNPAELLAGFMSNRQQQPSELMKGIEWLQSHFDLGPQVLQIAASGANMNQMPAKWLVENYITCSDLDSMKWIFELAGLAEVVNPRHLKEVCENRKDNVEVVKFIAQKVTTSSLEFSSLQRCLVAALACNNTQIATWLDDTFSLIEKLNSYPTVVRAAFVSLFETVAAHPNRFCLDGAKWLLQHVNTQYIQESDVANILEVSQDIRVVLLIVRHLFPSSEGVTRCHFTQACWKAYTLLPADLSSAKELVALAHFTKEQISHCVSFQWMSKVSSKVLKWMIKEFQLDAELVKSNNNFLLNQLIEKSKTSISEWTIHTFHITLEEFIKMRNGPKRTFSRCAVKLATWKMLLRVFQQGITPAIVLDCFMDFVLVTPAHIEFTIRSLLKESFVNCTKLLSLVRDHRAGKKELMQCFVRHYFNNTENPVFVRQFVRCNGKIIQLQGWPIILFFGITSIFEETLIVLAGMKSDLPGRAATVKEIAFLCTEMREHICFLHEIVYVEASSLTGYNVDLVFKVATHIAMQPIITVLPEVVIIL
ncbi:hypothetical protein Pelo_1792 [Pelomyxa schiedti]|nr:hypothetical protein Pelo_1792 [Pelomyxa schiedti]